MRISLCIHHLQRKLKRYLSNHVKICRQIKCHSWAPVAYRKGVKQAEHKSQTRDVLFTEKLNEDDYDDIPDDPSSPNSVATDKVTLSLEEEEEEEVTGRSSGEVNTTSV